MAIQGCRPAAPPTPQETRQVLRREELGPVDLTTMSDSAQVSWSNHGSVFLQCAAQRRRCRRTPLGSPCCQLLIGQHHVHGASGSIDANGITVLDERQWAAHRRFRADVANAHTPRGTREAAISQQRHFLPHALTIYKGCYSQHLAHTRPAFWPLIADDDHCTRRIGALTYHRHAVFLMLEDQGRPCKGQGFQTSHLNECPVRTQVALEHDKTTVG